MIRFRLATFVLALVLSQPLFSAPSLLLNSNSLIENQYQKSVNLLFRNLSPADGKKGVVLAAPSRQRPDYYYHWVRDAALTIESILGLYKTIPSTQRQLKNQIRSFLLDYVEFNILIQKNSLHRNGLGEPKFYVNGSPYLEPWGRPQNDGPALRSITSIEILYLAGQEKWPEYPQLVSQLYIPQLNQLSLIKSDLEHVAHNWMNSSFDLWEEVNGNHFYTLMAQRKSLLMGASIAQSFKDNGASQYYKSELSKIDSRLKNFWNPSSQFILATTFGSVKSSSFVKNKSQLDTAVLLGVLHSEIENTSFSVIDPRVFSTYLTLKKVFGTIYTINQSSNLNTALGRYPEDTYDGYGTNGRGNPWVLSTTAAAEYLYRLSTRYLQLKKIEVNFANAKYFSEVLKAQLSPGQVIPLGHPYFNDIMNHLAKEADAFLLRVIYHANADGSLSEQINRENGYMQGAPNLTWSHASFITAKIQRDRLLKAYKVR